MEAHSKRKPAVHCDDDASVDRGGKGPVADHVAIFIHRRGVPRKDGQEEANHRLEHTG